MNIRTTNTGTDKEDTSSAWSLAADKDEESHTLLLDVTASPPASSVPTSKTRKIFSIFLISYGGGLVGVFGDIIIGAILAALIVFLLMRLDFIGIVNRCPSSLRN